MDDTDAAAVYRSLVFATHECPHQYLWVAAIHPENLDGSRPKYFGSTRNGSCACFQSPASVILALPDLFGAIHDGDPHSLLSAIGSDHL